VTGKQSITNAKLTRKNFTRTPNARDSNNLFFTASAVSWRSGHQRDKSGCVQIDDGLACCLWVWIPYFFAASKSVNRFQVSDFTVILEQIERGDSLAASRLLPLVYDELRKLAAQKLTHETPGQTLQATALVHEAWLRLGGDRQATWQNRAHFFAAAAEAMRRILIDNARRKKAARHGGQAERVNLDPDSLELAAGMNDDQILAVHEALDGLAAHDAVKAELVKLRFFTGLTLEEAARVLDLSEPTAKRYWAYARAWLYREIKTNTER
jgi:RNA polymerase sigma factor (TIGR02999 family)